MFVGGYQRECLCGLSFMGTAEESFAQRDRHISEMNASQADLFPADVYSNQGHQAELGL
jgi:hypothetical protein